MNSGLLKRLWPFLKWGMFIVVLVFVARHGHKLWTDVDRHPTRLNWGWLALATVASVVAWLPSAWYWRKLIVNLGFSPPWTQVLRSYYCGHLGKYMPGKAAAIVIRAALIRDSGVPTSAAALTVTAESVTYMGAGTLLAVLLYSSLAAHLPPGIAATAADARWRTGLVVLLLGGGLAGLAAGGEKLRSAEQPFSKSGGRRRSDCAHRSSPCVRRSPVSWSFSPPGGSRD